MYPSALEKHMLQKNVNEALVYKEDQGAVMAFHLENQLRTSTKQWFTLVHDGVMPFYNFSKS